MMSASGEATGGTASILRGAGTAVFAIVLVDAEHRAGFSGLVADDLAERPECRVATVATDLIAVDCTAMAAMLRSHAPDRSRTLVIGHDTDACLAIALAQEMAADAALLFAPAWSGDQDISGALHSSSSVSISAITGTARANVWPAQVPEIDERHLPLPNAALPAALRQSGAMPEILTAMLRGGPLPDLSGLVARWHRRNAYRIELAAPVLCSATGEVRVHGRILNTGEAALLFGRAGRDRLLIGARIRSAPNTVWTREARALPAHPELEPADSARFVIGLAGPAMTAASDFEIELSLVSEGSFWYSDLGFPALRLGNAASSECEGASSAPRRHDDAPNRCEPDRAALDPATLDDLSNCYRLILGRMPDPDGFAYYARLVQAGMTVDRLVLAFVSAPEAVARFDALRQTRAHGNQAG